jgi:hypothetical protein
MLKRIDNYEVEILLTLALAMRAYALAERLPIPAGAGYARTIIGTNYPVPTKTKPAICDGDTCTAGTAFPCKDTAATRYDASASGERRSGAALVLKRQMRPARACL